MMILGKILIIILLVNPSPLHTLAMEPYDAKKFVGKWYVVAIVNAESPLRMHCMQRYVFKHENDIFTIVTSVVCRGCSYGTFTAKIDDSTIYNIVADNSPNPWNITISKYHHDNEIVLYDISQQDYYLMRRTSKISDEFAELCWSFIRRGWKVHIVSHEGCE